MTSLLIPPQPIQGSHSTNHDRKAVAPIACEPRLERSGPRTLPAAKAVKAAKAVEAAHPSPSPGAPATG
ncbi:MAG: hypothetical protein J0H49_37290 [Acidobacteria bacterium]|nr:hypothetical protein [Acidobacteriota bacterium]